MIPLRTARQLNPTPDTTNLPVSEVFGPTLQGEGPYTGTPVHFIRLGGCNLSCYWCDTPWTWDATRYDLDAENPPVTVAGIVDRLRALGPAEAVVLTGGEPLIHHHRLEVLLGSIGLAGYAAHVETNGTIGPPAWWNRYVGHTSVSPKVATDDPVKKRIKPRALAAWAELAYADKACFKFVCRNEADVDAAAVLAEDHDIPRHAVWIMPEGTTVTRVLNTQRALAPAVLRYGFHLTTRLHTLLWPDEERGR